MNTQSTKIFREPKINFWVGLILMVLITLFPGGILQMVDVLNNGYWHARSQAFLGGSLIKFIEWIRIVPDLIFMLAALLTYLMMRKKTATA